MSADQQEFRPPPISWVPPAPRPGWRGSWDRFVGPGATGAELLLQFGAAFAAGIAVALLLADRGFSTWEVVLGAMLAFDLAGGVVTNATTSGQRWYHRPGVSRREEAGFVALHGVHVLLVALVFLDGDWLFFGVTYGFLMLATVAILTTPQYLMRPFAHVCFVVATMVGLLAFDLPDGLQWFVPLFFCKLLLSHLTREAPFAAPAHRAG